MSPHGASTVGNVQQPCVGLMLTQQTVKTTDLKCEASSVCESAAESELTASCEAQHVDLCVQLGSDLLQLSAAGPLLSLWDST